MEKTLSWVMGCIYFVSFGIFFHISAGSGCDQSCGYSATFCGYSGYDQYFPTYPCCQRPAESTQTCITMYLYWICICISTERPHRLNIVSHCCQIKWGPGLPRWARDGVHPFVTRIAAIAHLRCFFWQPTATPQCMRFVFVHLYLCICICVFVFVFLYLCILAHLRGVQGCPSS